MGTRRAPELRASASWGILGLRTIKFKTDYDGYTTTLLNQ